MLILQCETTENWVLKGLGEFFKNSFFSIIRVPKSIYNCQILLLAPADLSGCPRHMWLGLQNSLHSKTAR